MKKRYALVLYSVMLALGTIFHGAWIAQAQAQSADHQMINLYPKGPRPQMLTIKIGTPVVWQSHLAHSKAMVVTVAFHDGKSVAQATRAVKGINGFVLEGSHFVGRMEGNGGTVALTFTAPGAYIYTLGHGNGLTGTIVVRP